MGAQGAAQVLYGDLPDELAVAFAASKRVAWDVETSGLNWRTDRLGTCQLFADDVGAAVISVNDHKPARMAALLEDPDVEKAFHHAPFDLRFMVNAWGVRPSAIRCTKVASKLLQSGAPNEAHSLQSLASRYLGVSLAKGQVRTSDWTASRLSAEQLEYAVADVLHLPTLLVVMSRALEAAGLADLYDACCAFLPARVTLELGDYPDVFAYLPTPSVASGSQRSLVKKRKSVAGAACNRASRRKCSGASDPLTCATVTVTCVCSISRCRSSTIRSGIQPTGTRGVPMTTMACGFFGFSGSGTMSRSSPSWRLSRVSSTCSRVTSTLVPFRIFVPLCA